MKVYILYYLLCVFVCLPNRIGNMDIHLLLISNMYIIFCVSFKPTKIFCETTKFETEGRQKWQNSGKNNQKE